MSLIWSRGGVLYDPQLGQPPHSGIPLILGKSSAEREGPTSDTKMER